MIDFGVAKAIEQRLTEKTVYTQFGTLVGTFEYTSPEQAEMSAFGVDTRSDFSALGVLLYELLTGTTPLERQRLGEVALDEMVRLIKEEEAPRPSIRLSNSNSLPKIAAARNTEPAQLSKLIRGDIDWIVMKCLEKDRTRRYDSANGLARDIQRHAVKIWAIESGGEIAATKLTGIFISGLSFSPDGKRVAVVGHHSRLRSVEARVLDSDSLREVLSLQGHTLSVTDAVFSPDGKRLATASADRTIRLWDLTAGREILKLSGFDGAVSLRFISNGRRLMSASMDRTIRIWDATPLPE